MSLKRALEIAHLALLLCVAGAALTAPLTWVWRLVALVLAIGPLGAALPGLMAGRRYTCQWLSVLLVLYVGVAVVEVLAAPSRMSFASLALLAALVELALVLAFIRQTPAAPRESAAR